MKILGAILPDDEDAAGRGSDDGGGGLRFETKRVMVKRRIRRREMKIMLSAFLEAIVAAVEDLPIHSWETEDSTHTKNEDMRNCQTRL